MNLIALLPLIFLIGKLIFLNIKFLFQVYTITKQLEKGSYFYRFAFFEFNRVDIIQSLNLQEREKRLLIIYTLISPPLFMFLSKNDILDILPKQPQLSRTPRKQFWKLVNKQNVVKVNGAVHKVRRKLLSSYFQFDNIKIIGNKTESVSEQIFEQRKQGIIKKLKLQTLEQDFQEITQKIVCQTMFQGLTNDEQEEWELIQLIQDVRHMVRDLFETPFSKFRSLFINPENIPKILMTQNEKAAYSKLLKLRESFFEKLQNRKHSQYQDIISLYMGEIENQKKILLDKEGLFQDFMAIFAGSIDPVTTLSSNTIFQIGKNPEILRKVLKELEENMDKKTNQINYQNMDYLHNVVKEALRMFTTSPFLGQSQVNVPEMIILNNDLKNKLRIPQGYLVDCSLLTMMTAESNFQDPDTFKPERFLEQNQFETYLPFGGGNRVCFGQHLSPIQTKIVVCQFLLKFVIKQQQQKQENQNDIKWDINQSINQMKVQDNNKLIIGGDEVFLQYRKKACPACQTHFTPHCDPKKHLKSFLLSYNPIILMSVLGFALGSQGVF